MPRARIEVNASVGSNTDLPINTSVQFSNDDAGDETSYLWSVLDQPAGAADALSNTAIENPTFTPKKEGTYLVRLTVDSGLSTESVDQVIVGIRDLKTRLRVPAAGETTEGDTTDGWSTTVNEMLNTTLDAITGDIKLVGQAGAAGLGPNDVLYIADVATIKSGLPGEEDVPKFDKALANTAAKVKGVLALLISGVDGSSSPASGALLETKLTGIVSGLSGSPSVGDSVFVNNTATLSLSAGSNSRRVGTVISSGSGTFDVYFNGLNDANVPADHGSLTGLTDDDHTQYALLAGRAGGQTLIGGSASGEDLQLTSTSNASKGTIICTDAVEGQGQITANHGGSASPTNNVALTVHNHDGSNGGGTRLSEVDRRRVIPMRIDGGVAAGVAHTERTITGVHDACTAVEILVYPAGTLTANDTNFATIKVYKRNNNGTGQTLLQSVTTKTTTASGTGDWTAFSIIRIVLGDALTAGQQITMEITKSGSGVALPESTACLEYTNN